MAFYLHTETVKSHAVLVTDALSSAGLLTFGARAEGWGWPWGSCLPPGRGQVAEA